jgi:hypothetical protein
MKSKKAVAPGASAFFFVFSTQNTPKGFSAFSMDFHSKCEKIFFRPVTKHLENVKPVLIIVPSIKNST